MWTGILTDVNVAMYGWWTWNAARGGLRTRRERRATETMERDRWARLAPAPALSAEADADVDADLGTRIARAYLRGVTVLDRHECEAVTAYIAADVSGRWPPSSADLRHIADAIGEPESLDYLRSVAPGPGVPGVAGGEPADGAAPEITDDTATAVTIRLLFTFCPPGRDRGDYLTSATFFTREGAGLPAADILPALLLRRGTNDRAASETAAETVAEAASETAAEAVS